MDQRQGHESLLAVAEVNSVGAKVLLEFIADFGKPTAPLPAAIVACVPTKVHIDEVGETEFKITPTEIIVAIEEGLDQPITPSLSWRFQKNGYNHQSWQISKTETQTGVMRLIVGGGRAAESSEARGSVIVGVRTFSEGGRDWKLLKGSA